MFDMLNRNSEVERSPEQSGQGTMNRSDMNRKIQTGR